MSDNQNDAVVTADDGRVRTISINRPDALNAMNNEVFSGIAAAFEETRHDDAIAVAIITGVGRAFCAGLDLDDLSARVAGELDVDTSDDFIEALVTFPKPLIAAVNGLGVGVGMTMLAYSDIAMMSSDAKLRTPFPQLGLAPEAGSSYTFQRRMGWQAAAYTLMSGRWFSAHECKEMGLVWRVTSPATLMAETNAIAQEIARNPIPSLIATKQLMMAGGRANHALDAHARELAAYKSLVGAPANREALAAFTEKREPDFSAIAGS